MERDGHWGLSLFRACTDADPIAPPPAGSRVGNVILQEPHQE
jgi:hypothetical protein